MTRTALLTVSTVALVGLLAAVLVASPEARPAREANPDLVERPNYFTKAMTSQVTPAGLTVWQSAPMPPSNDASPDAYPYYPAHIVSNNDIVGSLASATTDTQFSFREWGQRCDLCAANDFNKKANETYRDLHTSAGVPVRTSATTYERAMATQLAIHLHVLGYPETASSCPDGIEVCGWRDATRAAGIADANVVSWETARAGVDRYFTIRNGEHMTAIDFVILPPARLPGARAPVWGVLCVCEFADRRPASMVTRFVEQLARTAHYAGYKFAIAADQLLGSGIGAGFCGVGISAKNCDAANLNAIVNMVDFFMVGFGKPPRGRGSFTQVIAATVPLFGLRGSYPSKVLMANLGLGAWPGVTTIADAQALRAVVVEEKWGGVTFVRAHAGAGGGQCRFTNLKIQIMTGLPTGACPLTPETGPPPR